MRAGWEIRALGEVCEIYQPKTLSAKDLDESGQYFVYGANGIIGKYTKYNHEDSEVILTCRGSTCGTINVSLPFSWINGNAMVVRPKDKVLLKEYLKYLLRGIDYSKVITGAAQPQITREKLAPSVISFPKSTTEQQRIVSILDQEFTKIDTLKANAEKSLQAAKDLFIQMLAHTFSKSSWTWERIGDVFDTGSGGTPLKTFKEYYEGGTIPWLRSGEVSQKYITETEMFITQLGLENSSAKMFPSNTVVVAMYGATAGQVGILHTETTTNQAVCGIFPQKGFVPEFVYYSLLNSKEGLVAQATGNAQPNISQIKIKNTTIPVISLEEQETVVSNLDGLNEKCEALQENYQKTLVLCDDLKQALLRKAFNGEL